MKILVLNCGSSSLKYQLINMETEEVLASGKYERIGESEAFLTHKANGQKITLKKPAYNHTEAIEFTLEQLTNTEYKVIDRLKEINSIYSTNVQYVVGVDIVDDYTIQINLDREVPFFEYNLTFPIMSKEYYETEDFVNTSKNANPVGTGKYKITAVEPSYIILEKNQNWWDKEKNLTIEKITINLYSSIGELYNSFKIGNIDEISTENNNIQEYIGTIGYNPKEIKGREHTFLALNTANNFLSKIEVRRAISYCIDKENINSNVLGHKCYTSSFPLDYGNWLSKEQDSSSGYNVEQAKQILADSGWTYRNQYWQKRENGKTQRIELNLLTKQSDLAVAQNIEAQLESQGIRINIVQVSNEQYKSSIASRSYDIAICNITMSPSPDLEIFFGEGNMANYMTDETRNIINEVKNTTDEAVLQERYKRLIEIYKTEIPYISLYFNKYTVAYSSGLVGELTPTWFYQYYGIEGWYK